MNEPIKSTVHYLLGKDFDTEYTTKFLAVVSTENFEKLKDDVFCRFDADELGLTDADIKEAWKCWFDWAANNGTLINIDFDIINADGSHVYPTVHLIDYLLETANVAIDNL